jgi:ubiquinone/menaquinone biosynthesis C-methylase UbiE
MSIFSKYAGGRFLNANKESIYEASFDYSKGAFYATPRSWKSFAWSHLGKRMADLVVSLVKERKRILYVGVGSGSSLSNVGQEYGIQKIGIDINKKFLRDSREDCDVILASALHLPLKECSIDLAFFELVLHHLKGQRCVEGSMKEAYRVLVNRGKLIAVEPNSMNPSGFLMNLVNTFHLYSAVSGGSNYEFALTPKEIRTVLSDFSCIEIIAFSYLHPRFPLSVQRSILRNEGFLNKRFAYFAWMLLIVACK